MNKLHDIGWLTTGHPTPSARVTDATSHTEAAHIYNTTPDPEPMIERKDRKPVALGELGVGTTELPRPEGF